MKMVFDITYLTTYLKFFGELCNVHIIPHTYLTYITDEVSTSLATLSGHSGPINQVLLALPFALSASGCSVR